MAQFRCKMCGGDLEIAEGVSVAECEYCGTRQTLPRLDDERRAQMYDRANHFRRNNEFDKAMGIYEQILSEDNTDSEAYWSIVLCRYGIEYVEDPVSKRRIPTVNRAQFTSIFDDENYRSALSHCDALQRAVYEAEAKEINEIQKGILAISRKEEPFDVFICYKETDSRGQRTMDSVLAQDLYHQLTAEGLKVFFARITLEDKLGSAYEPYIFAALNSAKVMVVLGTRAEYFNATWVKNEWSRFLSLVKQSHGEKVLVPAYRDIDPYDLPEEFAHLQAQDMSKLGFMQDLVRGVVKIARPIETVVVKEAVAVTQSANVAPLLKRVNMFLADEEWASADEYCEKVLDLDPECGEAYLGKLMAELHIKKREDLAGCKASFEKNKNYIKALQFADKELKEGLAVISKDKMYSDAISYMESSKTHELERAIEMFTSLGDWKHSGAKLLQTQKKLNELRDKEKSDGLKKKLAGEQANKRKKKSRAFVAIIGAVIVLAIIIIGINQVNLSNKYAEMVACINSGRYVEAAHLCEELNGYKDSRELIKTIVEPVLTEADRLYREGNARAAADYLDSCHVFYPAYSHVADGYYDIAVSAGLTYIRIPDGVTFIPQSAFSGSAVETVIIPDGVTYIENDTFINCTSLVNVEIPDSVRSIGNHAFANCTSLESIDIPDSVSSIGSYAFYQCSALKSLVIPNDVTYIGADSLAYCASLESLTLPFMPSKNELSGLRYLFSSNVYSGSEKLNKITLTNCETLCIGAFYYDFSHKITEILLPDTLKAIEDDAFYSCSSLVSIDIPDSVSSIGSNVFGCCTSLEQITLPKAINVISESMFDSCSSLESFEIPEGVTEIGKWAFSGCESLNNLVIPDSVTSIEESAFSGCSSLRSLVVPDSVTYMGEEMLSYCVSLHDLTVPFISFDYAGEDRGYYGIRYLIKYGDNNIRNVVITGGTRVEKYAFDCCEYLESVTLPEGITEIDDYAFEGCSSLTEIILPDSLKRIGSDAFYYCTALKSISIPSGVATIGGGAFYHCISLESVKLCDGLNVISESAFGDCQALKSISIPESVTEIGEQAFWNCPSLETVELTNPDVTFGNDVFTNSDNIKSLTIPMAPAGDSLTYTNGVERWLDCELTNLKTVVITGGDTIGEYSLAGLGQLESVVIPDTVTGIESRAFYSCKSIKSITIPDSVTYIGEYAFAYSDGLESITIPGGVTEIGTYAFGECASLTSVKIGYGVKKIGGHAFYRCKSLSSVKIPDSVTEIGHYAFSECATLGSVSVPDSVASIGGYAFSECKNLVTVTIAYGVETIGQYAFNECSSLRSLVIPDSVTAMGHLPLHECSSLTELTVPFILADPDSGSEGKLCNLFGGYGNSVPETLKKVTVTGGYIPDEAFAHCKNIKKIVLPDDITSIGARAFYSCTSLTEITIPDSVNTIGDSAFSECTSLAKIIIPDSVSNIGLYVFINCGASLTIYCRAAVKPSGWEISWNGGSNVVWNYKGY